MSEYMKTFSVKEVKDTLLTTSSHFVESCPHLTRLYVVQSYIRTNGIDDHRFVLIFTHSYDLTGKL